MLTLGLLASVSVQAQSLDELITTSGSIVDTFDTGIKTVAGMQSYSSVGGIAPDNTVDAAYITQEQADAYNLAVQTLDTSINAQEFFTAQADQSRQQLDAAIGSFVGAATAIIEVTVVNNMAQEAANSGDTAMAAEVQAYVTENNVTLETQEIDAYNDSLASVEAAAQSTAAFTAVAADASLTDAADQAALDAGVNYSTANAAFFDSANGLVSVDFANASLVVALDVTGYFKTVEEIYAQGETDSFYTTGPTANPCFFEQETYDQCMADNGLVF